MLAAVLAFLLATTSDYLSTAYYRAVHAFEVAASLNARRAARWQAAGLSAAICLVGVVGLYGCVTIGWWLVGPELLGYVVGTLLALRR